MDACFYLPSLLPLLYMATRHWKWYWCPHWANRPTDSALETGPTPGPLYPDGPPKGSMQMVQSWNKWRPGPDKTTDISSMVTLEFWDKDGSNLLWWTFDFLQVLLHHLLWSFTCRHKHKSCMTCGTSSCLVLKDKDAESKAMFTLQTEVTESDFMIQMT